VSQKTDTLCHRPYLLQILADFHNFFHWHTLWTICNKVVIKYLTKPWLCCYTTLWNSTFIVWLLTLAVKLLSINPASGAMCCLSGSWSSWLVFTACSCNRSDLVAHIAAGDVTDITQSAGDVMASLLLWCHAGATALSLYAIAHTQIDRRKWKSTAHYFYFWLR